MTARPPAQGGDRQVQARPLEARRGPRGTSEGGGPGQTKGPAASAKEGARRNRRPRRRRRRRGGTGGSRLRVGKGTGPLVSSLNYAGVRRPLHPAQGRSLAPAIFATGTLAHAGAAKVIRRRIRSVSSTKKITRTMEMVATAKLRPPAARAVVGAYLRTSAKLMAEIRPASGVDVSRCPTSRCAPGNGRCCSS